jgi:hypothetical protein
MSTASHYVTDRWEKGDPAREVLDHRAAPADRTP